MSASLKIKNNFYMVAQGVEDLGKQGSSTDDVDDYFTITVTGLIHKRKVTLVTGSSGVTKVFDSANDVPANPVYWFWWCDQASYIQFMTASINFTVPVAAKAPFVISSNNMLAAANTTAFTTEPSVAAIAKVYVGQYSGNTANGLFAGIQ